MKKSSLAIASVLILSSTAVLAKKVNDCPVTNAQLNAALSDARKEDNGQFSLDMWATVVNNKGIVCAVSKTGEKISDQWLASRVISAQKAYSSASLSNNKGSAGSAGTISVGFTSAGLYTATQPGGSLFGLQHSNPVDTKWAYHGNSKRFGTAQDPMVGRYVGGINVFGGGLPLFDADGQVVGGLGVSGNTSCADHNIAWRIRGDFATQGIAQGADFEFGIGYEAGDAGYPLCGKPGEQDPVWQTVDEDSNGVDDRWEGGISDISQMMDD